MKNRNIVHCQDGTIWIFLGHNKVAEIDQQDEDLTSLTWTAVKRHKTWYATATVPGVGKSYMHRIIGARKFGDISGKQIDHEDTCGLSNKRNNLRIANYQQNNCNKNLQKNNRSGHKGVAFCKRTGKWRVQCWLNGKPMWGGRHETIDAAIESYKRLSADLHGEFSRPI